jgi:hypothetical protein
MRDRASGTLGHDLKITRMSIGSHENPTDSDFDVTGRFPIRGPVGPVSAASDPIRRPRSVPNDQLDGPRRSHNSELNVWVSY